MLDALRFLAVIEALGLAALPLARRLFGRLPGGGAAFAKPLGVAVVTWVVWVAGSAGVPYGTPLAVAGGLSVLGASVLAAGGGAWRAGGWRGGELVFLGAFAAMAVLVRFWPDVWGTERPMDMAIVTATNASTSFPPHDPWMAGEKLNYYYLGHLGMALVIRLSGVAPERGYLLALAALFALTAVAAFGLGRALGGRRAGLVALVFVLVLGNLAGARELVRDGWGTGYDWFAPSRVVPHTITEFPAFSFLLGDLHAHVLALPATLLVLALGAQAAVAGPRWGEGVAAAILLAGLLATNAWSFPVAAGLLVLLAATRRRAGDLGWALAAVLGGLLAAAPFLLAYGSPTGGLGWVGERRGPLAFLGDQALLYGLFAWVLAASFLARRARWPLLAVGAVATVLYAPAGLAVLAGLALEAAFARRGDPAERVAWVLVAGGLACLALPELVYVRDEFAGSALYRMNTLFKLGYQAWLLLALAAAVVVVRRCGRPRAWLAGVLALALASAVYPIAGTYARTDGLRVAPTLDGLRWLARAAPGDVAAIDWLRAHARGDAVVLEAVGEDYAPAGPARISTFTGRPTVLGWPGHELQWGHDPGRRGEDVAAIYAGARDPRPLLRRYGVRYVVLGPLERATYPGADPARFDALGRRVLDRDGTIVWAL